MPLILPFDTIAPRLTTRLQTGQRVRVDGTSGRVALLDEEAEGEP